MPLRELTPATLLPERHSPRTAVISWLKRIDFVHVRETSQKGVYAVDVHMQLSHSRFPTRRASGELKCRAPESTTLRAFSDFSKLLSDLYDLAHAAHGFLPCSYCVAFVDYVLTGQPAPSVVHKWFHTEVAVCERLTEFTNNLLELTRRVRTYDGQCECIGKQQAPKWMKAFLVDDDQCEGRGYLQRQELE